MNGSGRAGELTFTDLRARLTRITGLLADAEKRIDGEAADVAAARDAAQAAPSQADNPPG